MGSSGSTDTNSSQQSVSQVSLPPWINDAAQQNYALAQQVSQRPLTQYTGQQVADIGPQTQQAWNLAAQSGNAGADQYNASQAGYLTAAGTPATQVTPQSLATTNLQPYMNPYTQSVINNTLPLMQQQNALAQNQQANAANSANAFGGSKQGIQQGVAQAQGAMNIGQMAAQLNQGNFNQAQAAATGDITRNLQGQTANQGANQANINSLINASTGLGGLGNQAQQNQRQQFLELSTAGAQQQQQAQNQIGAQMNTFNQANAYPTTQLGILQSALGMTPYGSTTMGSTSGQQQQTTTPSTMSDVMGGLQALGGAFGSGGPFAAGGALAGLMQSDRNLKTDVQKVGVHQPTGLPIYGYRYKGDPKSYPKITGPMAEDVMKIAPHAVQTVGVHPSGQALHGVDMNALNQAGQAGPSIRPQGMPSAGGGFPGVPGALSTPTPMGPIGAMGANMRAARMRPMGRMPRVAGGRSVADESWPDAVNALNGQQPIAFIMHHTAGRSDPASVVKFWQQQGRGYGAQYIMDRNGVIHDTQKEFGYGGSNEILNGNGQYRNLNNHNVVGMEIVANDDSDVTDAQKQAAAQFIQARYPNTPVYGHGQVNSGHKEPSEGLGAVNAVLASRGQPLVQPDSAPGTTITSRGAGAPPATMTPGTSVNDFYHTAMMHESGGKNIPNAAGGAAAGYYQFTPPTWASIRAARPDLNLPDNPMAATQEQQTAAYHEFAKQNVTALQGAGLPINDKNAFMASFLGGGGASKFLNQMGQNPNASAADLFPNEAKANPTIFYNNGKPRSLNDVFALETAKFGTGNTTGFGPNSTPGTTLNSAPAAPAGGPGAPAAPGAAPTGLAGSLPGFQPDSPGAKMTAKGLDQLAGKSKGGSGGDDQSMPPMPQMQLPQPMVSGAPMMMGAGGQNSFGQRAAQQYLAQQGFQTQPSLQYGGANPLNPPVPAMPLGQATGIPNAGLPGTTLNSPSQLQMALMTGQMSPYDIYAQQQAAGGGGSNYYG